MRGILLSISLFFCSFYIQPVYAQLTSDFTANVFAGCGSLQVSFSDLSTTTTGSINSWSWNLGGVNSSAQNPGRIFGSPGNYTICLTVTNSNGMTDTNCKQNFISVYDLPDPAFTVDTQEGCAPSTITFSDASSSSNGDIVQWIWGLGGTTGVVIDNDSGDDVMSTYEFPDNYTVSLTVVDENGCINAVTAPDFITIYDYPLIDVTFSDTFSCTTPFEVTAINNNPNPEVNYFWDFGNGTPLFEGPNPPAAFYQNDGTYSITVIAVNNLTECRDTLYLEEVINVGNAVAFSHSTNEGCEDLTVSFTNQSFPWVSNIQWDFGDGNTSNAASPTHVYTEPGCYIVTLSALAGDCTDSFSITECIEVFPLPEISFQNDNPIGCVLPHLVNFNSFSITATSYLWDFGDGNTSVLQNPSHSFTSFGAYETTLLVTDENGCENSFTDIIEIRALESQIDFPGLSGCSPVDFTLSENSISLSPIDSWYWIIDTAFSDPGFPLFTSTEQSPSFSLVDTGWYDITLIVTNTSGCIDTVVNANSVGVGIPPVVDFEAAPLIACVDELIQFTDLSSDYGDAWLWNFGDGNTSAVQNPIYAYNTAPDTFDVSLSVAHNGCESSAMINDYIFVQVPLAGFSLERDCSSPFEVAFIDESVGADSIFWDFGYNDENDTSSLVNPIAFYPEVGCYTATQVVFNFTTGCIDTTTIDFCITVPIADFSLSPLSGCKPLNITVTNNSVFDVAWDWSASGASFSSSTIKNPVITYQNEGYYSDIQLIVTDMNNCRDTLVFTDTISVDGVIVDFVSLPSGGCNPLLVAFFDNSSSFISPLQSWSWNIGNGLLITSEPDTDYNFANPGVYPVSLTVTNSGACESTLNVPDGVNVTMVNAGFEAVEISCPADTVIFTDTSIGNVSTYNWDFGDGTFSNEANPGHQFSTTGTYNVCLDIYDFAGCEGSYCQTIDIVIPVADFEVDTTFANCPPLIVSFENNSLNSILYEWNFGDSSGNSNQFQPQHVYTVPGLYDVQLISSLNENCSDTLIIEDLIQVNGPVGSFSFDKDTACVGEIVYFIGNSDSEFNFVWDFGNGVLDTTFNVTNDTIAYVYEQVGVYTPSLTLLDSSGCRRTLFSNLTIDIGLLQIDFMASDTTLCEGGDEITFINLINSGSAITDFLWIFENGNPSTSSSFEPIISFPENGNFDVSLIVANDFCRDTLTKEDYIGAGALPLADFSASENIGCTPFEVQYLDQSNVTAGNINAWEWNFGGFGNSNEQNPSFTYNVPGTYDVTLTVTTEFGCSDSTNIEVTLNSPVNSLLSSSDIEICIGDTTQLGVSFETDTISVDFYWQNDPTLSCLDCLDPFVSPTETTTYYFITNTLQGCQDTSEITIFVLPYSIPDISITADTTLCFGNSIPLQVISDGMDQYDWDQSADSLSCYTNCNDPIANPVVSTLYTVTVTNSFGCDATASVFIEVIDQHQPFAGEDRTICLGDSVQLSLLVDGAPNWLNSVGLSCNNCNDPVAFPTETTSYVVQTVTDDFGCEIIDTIIVNVREPNDLNAGDDFQICLGESISFNAFTNGSGPLLWEPPDGLDDANFLNPLCTPTASTTYVISTTEDLCTLFDSMDIFVQLQTEVESFEYEICSGDTVQLSYVGEADEIVWSPAGTLSDEFSESPLAFPTKTTAYQLNAALSTCEEDTATALVIVNQGPAFSMPDHYNKFPGIDLQLNLNLQNQNGNNSYFWPFADGLSCNNCPDPVLMIDTSGFFMMSIINENNGCETTHRFFINELRGCDPELINMPNIFTPNEDGINDRTEIFSATISEITIFRIYSRWGAMLFETNDIKLGWDGNYRNRQMPPGVYIYYIEALCSIDGTTFVKKGSITLMR